MKKKDRIRKILQVLIDTNEYVTAKKLAEITNTSTRTVYSDLYSSEFLSLLFGAVLEKKPNAGICLIANEKQRNKIIYELNEDNNDMNSYDIDDIQSIIIHLLKNAQPIKSEELANYIYKSKNSLQTILKRMESILEPYHCSLVRKPNYGIEIIGTELDLRNLYFQICLELYQNQSFDPIFPRIPIHIEYALVKNFPIHSIREIIRIVNLSQVNLNTTYTNHDFGYLVLKLCILVDRNKIGKMLRQHKQIAENIQEFFVATIMRIEIEKTFHIQLEQQEVALITSYILSTRKTVNIDSSQYTMNESVIDKFVEYISERLDYDFTKDEELKLNLINHLRPAIRRMRFGLSSENPLVNKIKYEYTEVYVAVMTTIEEIEKQENIFFDANELGFICLHIVAALNRKQNKKNIKTLLLCNEGLTIEEYIRSKIENRFSELFIKDIVVYNGKETLIFDNYDLVLNATEQEITFDETISISTMVDENDISSIRHWIFERELHKTMRLRNRIKDHLLLFNDSFDNKEELLKYYSSYLETKQYVTSSFYESVIEREAKANTYIGRGAAVPHGSKESVLNSVIVIIHLDAPINWNGQNVDLVFLTAINDNKKDNSSYFFRRIFQIVSDEKSLIQLKQAHRISDVEHLFFQIENKEEKPK